MNGCLLASSVLFLDSPVMADVSTEEYTLKSSRNEQLIVSIEHHSGAKTRLENVTCKFYRVSSETRTLVGSETRGVGFRSETATCVGNFLDNGRKQVFVFMAHGATFGAVFDFDGQQGRTVYDSGDFGPRVWLRCIPSDGRCLIEEGWTPTDYSQPGFSIHRKSDNLIVRLVRWDGQQWSPIKFRFIDGQPMPVHLPPRTAAAVPRCRSPLIR